MGERISLNKENTMVFLYNSEKQIWEEKTSSVNSLFKAYYYGNFAGYDIYFQGTRSKFFYKKENVKIAKRIKTIDIKKKTVFVDDDIVNAIKVDEFDYKYYRITTPHKTVISSNIKLVDNKHTFIYTYYTELAKYAESISNDDEPLYFLAKNYQRLAYSHESVLDKYLQGKNENFANNNLLIVPFDYNLSQYNAISKALSNSISVIEGPPGTGKTQTILNLISNIVYQDKNCAVISNNNTAIGNVYEKLSDEGLSFIAATLGRVSNVYKFFEETNNDELNAFCLENNENNDPRAEKEISDISDKMKSIHKIEITIAKKKNELEEVLVEKRNFEAVNYTNIKINDKLSSSDYLNLLNRIENEKNIKFLERWFINLKFKVKLRQVSSINLLANLEGLFYKKRIEELQKEINHYIAELAKHSKGEILNKLKSLSKDVLVNKIKNHYKNIEVENFTKESYRRDYDNFLKRYPVVLSTSHSLLNNARKNFLFDYLIIDEASQGDLLSSVIAMSCAKIIVVVGDSKQLQQIEDERLYAQSSLLAAKYEVPETYRYESNSILKSVIHSVSDVPITLLREHYRCAPDIINFCNKMFYDGELIPMTRNTGQHLEIIKTVPGNHARKNPTGSGMYNQREIDELKVLLTEKETDGIGIITPFRYQAKLIQDEFQKQNLEADTIHKFQGRQKDEIILSFVVNSLEKNPEHVENRLYDFITDEKLLNVAISRGKNKVTAIVSDKLYFSENNIIHDFIKYAEYLYGDAVTKESSVTSVFDYLYSEHNKYLFNHFKDNPEEHKSELLMRELIEEILKLHKNIGYIMHMRLSKIIKLTDCLDDYEKKYVLHPWTHVDFLFYNKITKEQLFALEVDGIHHHEQNEKQSLHDEIKDKVLRMNDIRVYRFKTNEANEEQKLCEILQNYTY